MSWLPLFRRSRTPRPTRVLPRTRPVRPILELLEDRMAPAVFTTTTATDFSIAGGVNPLTGQILLGLGAGQVTLRSAIQAANMTPGGNTINLKAPGPYLIQLAGA